MNWPLKSFYDNDTDIFDEIYVCNPFEILIWFDITSGGGSLLGISYKQQRAIVWDIKDYEAIFNGFEEFLRAKAMMI